MINMFNDVPYALKRNFWLLSAINFLTSAQFYLPIYLLFGAQHLHLSFLQAGSLFLVAWIISLALDFPSGIIADRYGRQKVFMIGILLEIAGTLPFIFIKSYWILLFVSVLSGIGMALVSNTIIALIYEQAEEAKQQKYFQHANATAGSFSFIGRIVASLIGGVVYLLNPTLPYLLTAVALILTLVVGAQLRFPTQVEEQVERRNSRVITTHALKIFSSNKALVKFGIIAMLISIWGDYIFTYYQPYYSQYNVSSATLGIIYAAISVFSTVGTIAMRKLPDRLSPHAINSVTICGIGLTGLMMLLLQVPLAYFAPIGLALVSGFGTPNLQLYVNRHAPNSVRTSVLSIATSLRGVGSAVGIFVSLYLIGRVSSHVLLSVVIIGCAFTLLLNIGLAFEEVNPNG